MDNYQAILIGLLGIGFGWHMYKTGIKTGAESALEELHKHKIICYDNKGNIKPNQFWQEEE